MAWFIVAGGAGGAHAAASSATGVGGAADMGRVVAALRAAGLVEGGPRQPGEPGVLVGAGDEDEIAEAAQALAPSGRVLVVLAPTVRADPWQLLAAGAEDALPLTPDADVTGVLARLDRWATVDALVDSEEVQSAAPGRSASWRRVLRDVVEIARFTTSPLLLTGETGTGKEVVARLVHALDPRPGMRDLVLVDCTTVVPSLSGSEFFGHAKGAFTGAATARAGAFELADGGTLFLDEVGELPLALQAELLRVVQEGAFKPVGGTRWQSTRFRLLAATNRSLLAEQDAGGFRRDLYFRLAAATVRLPPLRERREDVVPLFRHFLAQTRPGGLAPPLDPAVAAMVAERDYPGNVRELRQFAMRVATRHVGDGPITVGDIPRDDRPARAVTRPTPIPADPLAPSDAASPAGAPPGTEFMPAQAWPQELERAIRIALTRGVGLKALKEQVADTATRIALAEAGGPGGAAHMLGVSRRAVDYRKAAGNGGPAS
ncbi:MAG TPA: sigma 54-interacting transcriptional regulator [Mycobacteriales bacterium]|nr:sigma 54-interacting transcriptional regulator [Mycobacteriales bacterium]